MLIRRGWMLETCCQEEEARHKDRKVYDSTDAKCPEKAKPQGRKAEPGCRGRGEGMGVTADARGRGVGSALLLNGSEGLTTSRMHRMSLDRTLSVIRMVNSV